MPSISLALPDCWDGQRPDPVELLKVECLGVDDIAASEMKTGGRTVLVTPYDPNNQGNKICCGQYGQWQVLTGLGGQIHRGLLVGSKFMRDNTTVDAPNIASEVDLGECAKPGDRCVAIRDRGRWYVTKLGEGGATAGTAIVLGMVMGGNTQPITVDENDPDNVTKNTYPAVKNFAFPLPLEVRAEGTQKKSCPLLPTVEDWALYELPSTATPTTPLPRLPDGLCYVKLQRPYSLGRITWDAFEPCTPEVKPFGKPSILRASYAPGVSKRDIHITWDTAATLVSAPLVAADFEVVTTSATPLLISSVSFNASDMEMTVVVTRDIEDSESVTITVVDNVLHSADSPPIANDAESATVTVLSYAGAITIALNRTSKQTYMRGELVALDINLVSVTDKKGVTLRVPDIISMVGNNSANVVYSNAYYAV